MYSEASEELPLDSPEISETKETNDVHHEKNEVLSGPLSESEPTDNESHVPTSSGSNEPPRLSVSESSVSPPVPKSQSLPEVSPAAKPRSSAKVGTSCYW